MLSVVQCYIAFILVILFIYLIRMRVKVPKVSFDRQLQNLRNKDKSELIWSKQIIFIKSRRVKEEATHLYILRNSCSIDKAKAHIQY